MVFRYLFKPTIFLLKGYFHFFVNTWRTWDFPLWSERPCHLSYIFLQACFSYV